MNETKWQEIQKKKLIETENHLKNDLGLVKCKNCHIWTIPEAIIKDENKCDDCRYNNLPTKWI